MQKVILNPTLQCADSLNLKETLSTIEELGNDMVHIDVMDGHYVPNLAINIDQIRAIRSSTDFTLDVHLMVTNPEQYIPVLLSIGTEYIAFHPDATSFSVRLLQEIRKGGSKAGIVINPSQTVKQLEEILLFVDYVIVMGVEPGFSGQTFLENTWKKIMELKEFRDLHGMNFQIEVDGGIDDINGPECVKMGADILVSGAFGVFRNENGLRQDYLYTKNILQR